MKTNQCQSRPCHSASSSTSGVQARAMNPPNSAIITLAVLLISAIPVCKSAPVFLLQPTEYEKLLNQIDDVCSSYLSEDLAYRASVVLEELCVMLGALQKSQDLMAPDVSKRFLFHYTKPQDARSDGRSSVLHPIQQLFPQLDRGERKSPSNSTKLSAPIPTILKAGCFRKAAEYFVGPGRMQSRGNFLYRPRNGRRSTEFV